MICKNCGYDFEGNFCSNCGQSADTKRIDYGYLTNEVSKGIFQVNRGFLYTLKELVIRPGHSIREFIEGQRKPHYKPLPFLLVTSTIYILWSYLTGTNTVVSDIISGMTGGMTQNEIKENMQRIHWVIKNQTYILLLLLPFFSLASYWAFLKAKYNYFEHLILSFYITGQQMLIYSILASIFFRGYFTQVIPVMLVMVYGVWAYNQFFNKRRFSANLLSILLMHIYMLFLVMTIISIVTMVYSALS